MGTDRFLPLFDEANSEWIIRPDLYLLARMGVADDEDDIVVQQVYYRATVVYRYTDTEL